MESNESPLVYLDNASTTWPKPESVYRFMTDFYRSTGVNPGRGSFDLALQAGALLHAQQHVATRCGLHCAPLAHELLGTADHGTVRFSIGPFNTEEHIDAAVAGVAEIARRKGSQQTVPAAALH